MTKEEFRKFLIKKNVTIPEVADRMGYSYKTIEHFYYGFRRITERFEQTLKERFK
jgi:plasmid maintenance system antidote protein VapI